eukprot:4968971-Prymnesium_polylepis.1
MSDLALARGAVLTAVRTPSQLALSMRPLQSSSCRRACLSEASASPGSACAANAGRMLGAPMATAAPRSTQERGMPAAAAQGSSSSSPSVGHMGWDCVAGRKFEHVASPAARGNHDLK